MATRFPADANGPRSAGGRPSPTRVVLHSVLVFLPATLAFLIVAVQFFTAWSGYLYPLRPDTIAALGHPLTPDRQVLPEAWGGPTLMGAWAVHACVAFGLQSLGVGLLLALCTCQNSIARVLSRR